MAQPDNDWSKEEEGRYGEDRIGSSLEIRPAESLFQQVMFLRTDTWKTRAIEEIGTDVVLSVVNCIIEM